MGLINNISIQHLSVEALDFDHHLRRILGDCQENIAVHASQECGLGVRVVRAFSAQRSIIVEAIDLGSFGVMAETSDRDRTLRNKACHAPRACAAWIRFFRCRELRRTSPLVLHQFVVPKEIVRNLFQMNGMTAKYCLIRDVMQIGSSKTNVETGYVKMPFPLISRQFRGDERPWLRCHRLAG